jgi:hypothetical protein
VPVVGAIIDGTTCVEAAALATQDSRARRVERLPPPLQTIEVEIGGGLRLQLPTVEEMQRIKAFLMGGCNAIRD